MSQSNIEHLFSLTAPGAARVSAAGIRISEHQLGFGEHFNQASIPTRDSTNQESGRKESPQPEPPTRPTAYPTQSQPESPQREPSSSTRTGKENDDRQAQTDSESSRADEDSATDQNVEPDATKPSAGEEQNSASHDDSPQARSEDAQSSAGIAASNAALSNPIAVDTTAAVIAEESTRATKLSEKTKVADSAATNERTRQLAANEASQDNPAEKLAAVAEHSAETEDGAESRARFKSAQAPDNDSQVVAASANGEGKKRNAATTLGSPPSEATSLAGAAIPTAADGRSNDESTADGAADAGKSKDDKPRRAAATRAAVAPLRVQPDAPNVIAAIAPQAGDATAGADADAASTNATKLASPKSDALVNMLGRPNSESNGLNRGLRAAGDEVMPRVDPARFIGRVAKAFQTAHERGGTLQLRLSPPELGSLRLELSVKEGMMTAALETETAAARRLLLDHLPALRDRLAEQNIRVERFDVDVRREGSGSQADDRAGQHPPQDGHSDQPKRRGAPINAPWFNNAAPQDAIVEPILSNDTGINLVA